VRVTGRAVAGGVAVVEGAGATAFCVVVEGPEVAVVVTTLEVVVVPAVWGGASAAF
jgi:hypothetical protein